MNKQIMRAALWLLLVGVLASCGDDSPRTEADKGYKAQVIRINYSVTYGNVVPHIVMLKGLLNDRLPDGLQVEWSAVDNSTDIRDSLVSEKLDMAMITMPTFIACMENQLPVVLLANSALSSARLYSGNPNIAGLDDIKPQHKISINNIGARDHLVLMLLSKEKYGEAKKFNNNLMVMSYADAIASLASANYIDGSIISFPSYRQADRLENVRMLLDLTPTIQRYQAHHVSVASAAFAEKNPALVKAVLEAFQEAMDFLNNRPAEAAELLAGYYPGLEASAIEAQITSAPLSFEISESAYDQLAALMYEVGIIPNPPKKFSELPNYGSIPKKP